MSDQFYTKGLDLAMDVQAFNEALSSSDMHGSSVDSAIRAIGIIGALFNGQKDGFRYLGFDGEAEASVAGSNPNSVGPGVVFQIPGYGSTRSRSGMVRGPRISSGDFDSFDIFFNSRNYDAFKAWDYGTTGFAHPELQMNIPVQANVSFLILAYTSVQIFPFSVTTKVSTRLRIGDGDTVGRPTLDPEGPAFCESQYAQYGVQQWFTLSAFHARYVLIENPEPADAGEPVRVENWLYREGTAGNNRLGNGYTVAFRIPV